MTRPEADPAKVNEPPLADPIPCPDCWLDRRFGPCACSFPGNGVADDYRRKRKAKR